MYRARRTQWRPESVLDLYMIAAGLFLLFAPSMFAFSRPASIADAHVIAAMILALSFAAIIRFVEWEEWINLVLGLWLIGAPWALGFLHTPAMHVSVAVGIVVAYLALLELWLIHQPEIVSRG